jgi:hypothetical protein
VSAPVITLTLSTGEATRSLVESDNGRFAETDLKCPTCARDLRVRGEMTGHDFDTYRSTAFCFDCGAQVGALVAKVSTIFGIEEDRAVLLHGRARVY